MLSCPLLATKPSRSRPESVRKLIKPTIESSGSSIQRQSLTIPSKSSRSFLSVSRTKFAVLWFIGCSESPTLSVLCSV